MLPDRVVMAGAPPLCNGNLFGVPVTSLNNTRHEIRGSSLVECGRILSLDFASLSVDTGLTGLPITPLRLLLVESLDDTA